MQSNISGTITLLFWSLIGVAFLVWVFLPRVGLVARWQSWRKASARERVEDALKYLFGRQQEGRFTSPESLGGALQLSSRKTYALIQQLEAQELVQPHNRELALTTEGQLWALQIVRAHRLWERYLADEARLPLDKIHTEAHRREHGMTVTQVNELDAALGHPISDPHGDPIPTVEGVFRPQPTGTPLTAWKMGEPGQIVHLEDEPPLAFAQIVAEGLRLGQVVRILEVSGERVTLTDGEREYTLAPAVAGNVFMDALPEAERMPVGAISLAELAPARKAQIISLDASCQGFTRRRFLDLGLTPGTRIFPELENSFGDPRAYRVRGTLIALRKDQAGLIWVLPETPTAN